MHYHLEIVLPPVADVDAAVEEIMEPWCENRKDGEQKPHAFWDYYVIGGRWAGDKFVQSLDQDRIQQFYAWCENEQVTVSSFRFGKQELKPPEQVVKVDAKWNELFTPAGQPHVACPLFKHSNNQYGRDSRLEGDIWPLAKSLHAHCSHIIFAGPKWVNKEFTLQQLKVGEMFLTETWNGCNWQKTDWDGSVRKAVELVKEHHQHTSDHYRALADPQDDWLCVTVDYHS